MDNNYTDTQPVDRGFIFVSLGLLLIFTVMLVLTIYLAYRNAKLPPPPPPLPLTPVTPAPPDATALTTENTCVAQHGIWYQGRCHCDKHWMGPHCEYQRHDPKYVPIGSPYLPDINGVYAPYKSFAEDSCSVLCDNDEKCRGFIYRQGDCVLIHNDITIPKNVAIPLDREPNLYIRKDQVDNTLKFQEKIFIAATAWSYPHNYWNMTETKYYKQLSVGTINKIDFVPRDYKMANNYTGLYSLTPFEYDEVEILLTRPQQCYIHRPGTPLQLPWQYQLPLYVIYVNT